jgi:hypothetical protein
MSGALVGLAIMVIGDSHMAKADHLINPLQEALLAEGATVDAYGMCGAMPADWVYKVTEPCRAERHGTARGTFYNEPGPTWVLSDLIAKDHPNLIIVELGDTIASYDKPEFARPWAYDQVRTLTGRIKAANLPCIWIGPSWGRQDSQFHKSVERVKETAQFLTQSVAPCAYVDSTTFAQPGEWPTTDGQHFTPTGYRTWAADITQAVIRLKSQVVVAH